MPEPFIGVAPIEHPETVPLWNAMRGGRFCLQRCGSCETIRFPPSPVCWRCLSTDTDLVDVEPSGTIATSVVVHRATGDGAWSAVVPYRCGLVDLSVGVRLPGIILCECDHLERGARVAICRRKTNGGAPVWVFAHSCTSESDDDL